MILINKFKENVLSNVQQFELQEGRRTYHFVKYIVGKAVYVYGNYIYEHENMLDAEFKLVAVLSDDIIYMVNNYMFYSEYPTGVVAYNSKVEELNKYISEKLFPSYYENLKTRELTEKEIQYLKEKSRIVSILGDDIKEIQVENIINKDNILDVLNGKISVNSIVNEYFTENENLFITRKSKDEALKEMIEQQVDVEEWEIELSKSLHGIDAKTVTVEFEVNGIIASEKIEKDHLLRKLNNKGYFDTYDFESKRKGIAIIEKLNVGTWKHDEKGVLTCEHIKSIKYNRKTIFNKN